MIHPQPEGAIELENAAIKNDMIYCKFRRDKLTDVQGRRYDLVNTPYHLLVAAGRELRSTYTLNYETHNFIIKIYRGIVIAKNVTLLNQGDRFYDLTAVIMLDL